MSESGLKVGDLPDGKPVFDPRARARHARYFEPKVVYHVISRTRGNLFLLRPDLEGEQRQIFAGVLAEAKENFPEVGNCGTAILSNHGHASPFVRSGDPRVIADYVAFFKRETARRWSPCVDWSGSLWDTYVSTAVITPNGQLKLLKYILGQGVKEGLVADPRQWPGLHCAESLSTGVPLEGYWFDGTGYGKAVHAEKVKKHPREVQRDDFELPRTFSFDKLPAFEHLSDADYQQLVNQLIGEIVDEGDKARDGRPALGAEGVCAEETRTSVAVPPAPWFEKRRRMIIWDDPTKPEVQGYLDRYWEHQHGFRAASATWRQTPPKTSFPTLSFVPGFRARPIAHMEQTAA